ncbi:hypothetical protein ACXET9_08100 [Brachybacterium sp. DNPG3]
MKIPGTKLIASVMLGLVMCGGMGAAYAGTSYKSFSTTVPRINGSGYTSYQTKSISNANVQILSLTVGGDHVVDARVQGPYFGSSSWKRNLGDGKNINFTNKFKKGESVRLQFSNDLLTLQELQVEGKWRSQ